MSILVLEEEDLQEDNIEQLFLKVKKLNEFQLELLDAVLYAAKIDKIMEHEDGNNS